MLENKSTNEMKALNLRRRIEAIHPLSFMKGSRDITCSEAEIQKIEVKHGLKLPENYRFFLRDFGRANELIFSNDIEACYPAPLKLTTRFIYDDLAAEIEDDGSIYPALSVPKNIFLIAGRYHESFEFIFADGDLEDLPVFTANMSINHNSDVFKYEKFSDSVWEWVDISMKEIESWSI